MSKWIWIIAIVILVVLGFFLFGGGDDSPEGDVGNDGGGTNSNGDEFDNSIDDAPDSDFSGLSDSDEVFDEIDSALEFIE